MSRDKLAYRRRRRRRQRAPVIFSIAARTRDRDLCAVNYFVDYTDYTFHISPALYAQITIRPRGIDERSLGFVELYVASETRQDPRSTSSPSLLTSRIFKPYILSYPSHRLILPHAKFSWFSVIQQEKRNYTKSRRILLNADLSEKSISLCVFIVSLILSRTATLVSAFRSACLHRANWSSRFSTLSLLHFPLEGEKIFSLRRKLLE